MRTTALLSLCVVAILLGGCGILRDALKRSPQPGELHNDVVGIAAKCGAPMRWFRVTDSRTLVLDASPNPSFEQVDCVLTKTRQLPYKFEMAFVGREVDASEAR